MRRPARRFCNCPQYNCVVKFSSRLLRVSMWAYLHFETLPAVSTDDVSLPSRSWRYAGPLALMSECIILASSDKRCSEYQHTQEQPPRSAELNSGCVRARGSECTMQCTRGKDTHKLEWYLDQFPCALDALHLVLNRFWTDKRLKPPSNNNGTKADKYSTMQGLLDSGIMES